MSAVYIDYIHETSEITLRIRTYYLIINSLINQLPGMCYTTLRFTCCKPIWDGFKETLYLTNYLQSMCFHLVGLPALEKNQAWVNVSIYFWYVWVAILLSCQPFTALIFSHNQTWLMFTLPVLHFNYMENMVWINKFCTVTMLK
jgi:hypothetical protein